MNGYGGRCTAAADSNAASVLKTAYLRDISQSHPIFLK